MLRKLLHAAFKCDVCFDTARSAKAMYRQCPRWPRSCHPAHRRAVVRHVFPGPQLRVPASGQQATWVLRSAPSPECCAGQRWPTVASDNLWAGDVRSALVFRPPSPGRPVAHTHDRIFAAVRGWLNTLTIRDGSGIGRIDDQMSDRRAAPASTLLTMHCLSRHVDRNFVVGKAGLADFAATRYRVR